MRAAEPTPRRWSRPWLADGILAGVPFSRLDPDAGLDDVLLLAATETTTGEDIAALSAALKRRLGR